MSQTKIVLNRQSDLILDNAIITNPSGIKTSNIYNEGTDEMLHYVVESLQLTDSAEISNRISGDESLAADLSAGLSTEESARRYEDQKLNEADQIRKSHYTFEIHGDDIKFWPVPTFGTMVKPKP